MKEKELAKFLKAGTQVNVNIEIPPLTVHVTSAEETNSLSEGIKNMSWKTIGKKEKELAKFLKAGTQVNVDIEIPPKLTTMEGRFGKQRMYIVETKEFGAVYVRPIKVAQIADLIGDLTKGYLVIEI